MDADKSVSGIPAFMNAECLVVGRRTMSLGLFAGPIFTTILVVNCYFYMFLEWWIPRENIDIVEDDWDSKRFAEVRQGSIMSILSNVC